MPDEKKLTVLQEQQKNKPEIDGFITEHLDDNLQKVASDFIAWLRENKMNPRWSGKINQWNVSCKSKSICTIRIDPWHINGHHRGYYDDRPDSSPCLVIIPRLNNIETYKEEIMSEGLQDVVWNNANACVYSERSPSFGMEKAPGCSLGKPCAPGSDITVLGKTIKYNCCGCFVIQIWNPDENTLNSVKKLLELEKAARSKK